MTFPDPPAAAGLQAAVRALHCLPQSQRRSVIHALLPVIDSLVLQRVPHEAIVQCLRSAGLEITLSAMRKALYRWRKRQREPTRAFNRFSHRPPRHTDSLAAAPSTSIQSKADLAKLRNSPDLIDLNALAELGRQK